MLQNNKIVKKREIIGFQAPETNSEKIVKTIGVSPQPIQNIVKKLWKKSPCTFYFERNISFPSPAPKKWPHKQKIEIIKGETAISKIILLQFQILPSLPWSPFVPPVPAHPFWIEWSKYLPKQPVCRGPI